ncbi:MAG: hypothetical protein FWH53_09550, partial [Leptospirales bacterium]|nr:hypothetical protein [Leptospirales bacterium]
MKKEVTAPAWRETPPIEKSYRSIFKWGAPDGYKHPNHKLLDEIKNVFDLDDTYFSSQKSSGDEIVSFKKNIKLKKEDILRLQKIAGKENTFTDEYNRLKFSTGKTIEEAINLRNGKVGAVS